MSFTYPLPQDTREVFTNNQHRCSNLSLLLDRYVGYKQDWKFQEEQKSIFLKNVASQFRFSPELIRCHQQRWQVIIQAFPHVQQFTASPEWRMVVGLGQSSILETSITLDRITGIPIIPGSALKGLAASYAMLCIFENTERQMVENHPDFKAIFGTQEESGKVIFLDAVPLETPVLEPDIMNNHYPDYYGDATGTIAPTPYQSPTPVYFLTLGKGSKFAFAIGSRSVDQDSQRLVNLACDWLKYGLSELGIGAKTAAGYGYFQI